MSEKLYKNFKVLLGVTAVPYFINKSWVWMNSKNLKKEIVIFIN
jgi:hypothetical protein